jgi:small subunit ribosomal protein S1
MSLLWKSDQEDGTYKKVEIPKAEEIGTSLGDLFKNIQL